MLRAELEYTDTQEFVRWWGQQEVVHRGQGSRKPSPCPSTADGQGFQSVRTVQQTIEVYHLYIAEFAPTLTASVFFLVVHIVPPNKDSPRRLPRASWR